MKKRRNLTLISMILVVCLILMPIPTPPTSARVTLLEIPGIEEVGLGENLTFNITDFQEYIPEETIERATKFEWDFDYSGTLSNSTVDAMGEEVNHTYSSPGLFILGLWVWEGNDLHFLITKRIGVGTLDLMIAYEPKVKPSKDLEEGDKIKFTVNISNIGDLSAENITVRVYWDKVDDDHIIGEVLIPKLAPQEGVNVTLTWKEAEEGDKMWIFFVLDPDDRIRERNEENNYWNMSISIEDSMHADYPWGLILGLIVLSAAIGYAIYGHYRKKKMKEQEKPTKKKKIMMKKIKKE